MHNQQEILVLIQNILELINTEKILKNQLINKDDFFKNHYLVIVLTIIRDAIVQNKLKTVDQKDINYSKKLLAKALKQVNKKITSIKKKQAKEINYDKQLEKLVDQLGLKIEITRISLLGDIELDELIRDIYKNKVLKKVSKKKPINKQSAKKATKKNTKKTKTKKTIKN